MEAPAQLYKPLFTSCPSPSVTPVIGASYNLHCCSLRMRKVPLRKKTHRKSTRGRISFPGPTDLHFMYDAKTLTLPTVPSPSSSPHPSSRLCVSPDASLSSDGRQQHTADRMTNQSKANQSNANKKEKEESQRDDNTDVAYKDAGHCSRNTHNLLLGLTILGVVIGSFFGTLLRYMSVKDYAALTMISFPGDILMRMLKMLILP
ncbi:hypothetical protein NQZ68_005532 [Dissostichus eleginoides]|nr:hypothetical protein NQZ68_005532 [Dissostichus eleginoides]